MINSKVSAAGGGLYLIGVLDPTAVLSISSIEMLMKKCRIEEGYTGSMTTKRDIPPVREAVP